MDNEVKMMFSRTKRNKKVRIVIGYCGGIFLARLDGEN
jgi:hypothetical protein